MNKDSFKNLSGRDILGIIADFIAIGGFLSWGINRLLQGSTGLLTLILLILGIGIPWLSFFYIYYRKVPTGKNLGLQEHKRPAYPEWSRNFAFTTIFVIPFLTIAGLLGWQYYQSLPSDKITILVTNFDGPELKNYRVTEIIIEQLRESTKEYNDVQIKTLGKSITAQEGSEVARTLGKKHKASIVLWGWYGKTEEKVFLTTHFELLQKSRYIQLHQEKQTVNQAVAELESFKIQTQLSKEMSYLILLTSGLIRYEAQDYDSAINRFTGALRQSVPEEIVDPDIIYFYRGSAYLFKSNYNQAITDYNRAIEINPNVAVTYNNRGIAYANKGDFNSAIKDFNKAIEINPDVAEFYNSRGTAYADRDDLDSAIRDYTKAIEINPNLAEVYNNRGLTYYYLKGDSDSATRDFDKAIEANPKLAATYNNRGIVYRNKGDLSFAISDYTKAIEIDPDYANAYNNRGIAYKKKGNKDKALTDFQTTLALTNDPNIIQSARLHLQELNME